MNLRGSGGRDGRLGWGIGKCRNHVKTVLTYFVLNKSTVFSGQEASCWVFSPAKFIITLASDVLDYCRMRWMEKTCKEKMLACILGSEVYLPQWKNRFYSQRVGSSSPRFLSPIFSFSTLLFFSFSSLSLLLPPSLSCLLSLLCSLYSVIFHWIRSLPWCLRRISDLKPISLKRNSFLFFFTINHFMTQIMLFNINCQLVRIYNHPGDGLRTLPMEVCLGCVNRDGQTFPLKMAPFSGGDPEQWQWEKENA